MAQARRNRGRKNRRRAVRLSKSCLDTLVERATTDCYNEAEQITGLFTMIEENLELPFETTVLGLSVTVQRVDLNDSDQIVAICTRGRKRQALPLLDLPLPSPRPGGIEWIEAYRHWARRGC